MQHPAIGHDDAKSAVTFREIRTPLGSRGNPEGLEDETGADVAGVYDGLGAGACRIGFCLMPLGTRADVRDRYEINLCIEHSRKINALRKLSLDSRRKNVRQSFSKS